MSRQSTILIIGAAGFIGTHLSDAALRSGWRLVGTSRSAGIGPDRLQAELAGLGPGARIDVACDLEDFDSLRAVVEAADPEAIVNAAGPASIPASWSDPIATARVHSLGTLNLLEAARAAAPDARILCLSSAEVYGSSRKPSGENDPLRPLTPYGAAKLAMEAFCDHHRRVHGQAIAIARVFNQVGPGLPSGNPVADFVSAVSRAEAAGENELTIGLGNPDAIRDFTDVRDAAEAVLAIVGRGLDGAFNICSGRATSMAGLVEAIDATTEVRVCSRVDADFVRPVDPGVKVGSPDVLAETIGWRAGRTLEQSLSDMLAAARAGTT